MKNGESPRVLGSFDGVAVQAWPQGIDSVEYPGCLVCRNPPVVCPRFLAPNFERL